MSDTLLAFSSPAEAFAVRDALRGIVGQSPPQTPDQTPWVGGWDEVQFRMGKTDTTFTKGVAGNVSIWDGDTFAGLADTGVNESAVCPFVDLGSGKWVLLIGFRFGYIIFAADCST